jgi:F-type H+-transporting ATPase subunit epsilon
MAETLVLEVVTPERQLLEATVDSVQVPGLDGELGILPGHTPLISQLRPAGLLTYTSAGATAQLVISEGFVEVMPDRVKVLAEVAERPEDIDVARAIAARERAEKLLAQAGSDATIDVRAASWDLEHSLMRIQVANARK